MTRVLCGSFDKHVRVTTILEYSCADQTLVILHLTMFGATFQKHVKKIFVFQVCCHHLTNLILLLSTYPSHVCEGMSLCGHWHHCNPSADQEVVFIRETAHCSEQLDHVAELTAVTGQRHTALHHLFTCKSQPLPIPPVCLKIAIYLTPPYSKGSFPMSLNRFTHHYCLVIASETIVPKLNLVFSMLLSNLNYSSFILSLLFENVIYWLQWTLVGTFFPLSLSCSFCLSLERSTSGYVSLSIRQILGWHSLHHSVIFLLSCWP